MIPALSEETISIFFIFFFFFFTAVFYLKRYLGASRVLGTAQSGESNHKAITATQPPWEAL